MAIQSMDKSLPNHYRGIYEQSLQITPKHIEILAKFERLVYKYGATLCRFIIHADSRISQVSGIKEPAKV